MKYLLALILLVFSLACFAAMYMQTDSNGNVMYSDTPEDHAKPITPPSTGNNISLPQAAPPSTSNAELTGPSPSSTAAAPQQQTGIKGYSSFAIINPADQETIQNEHDIPVTLKIEPSLHEGDRVQLYVDGTPAGDPSADLGQLAIHQIDRGEHQLTAAVLDSEGHVLVKTDNITVFIHYSALPTGSGGIVPVPTGGGVPSSPGSGITPPSGSGIVPSGSGVVPPASSGGGATPPASSGGGGTPPAAFGSGIVPGR